MCWWWTRSIAEPTSHLRRTAVPAGVPRSGRHAAHSQRAFRLPANLYLIGTMNSADRSTMAIDQALRRRFSFVEMPADAAVLAGWLEQNQTDDTFGPRVVHLFEELNRKLARDLGPTTNRSQLFHGAGIDRAAIAGRVDHHVRPLLAIISRLAAFPSGTIWTPCSTAPRGANGAGMNANHPMLRKSAAEGRN